MGKVLLDFDGTLAHRPGMWSQCLVDVLDTVSPGHGIAVDDIRFHLARGFPWHEPEIAHPHLSHPDRWWDNLEPHLRSSLDAAGADPHVAGAAARMVRHHYCDPERFELYPDTLAALAALKEAGWELVVLSNHVPELPSIVAGMGLADLIDRVFTSAATGYEKPHPEAFRTALAGANPSACFMVGDNPQADIDGARRIGLRAILVRRPGIPAERSAADLEGATRLIGRP